MTQLSHLIRFIPAIARRVKDLRSPPLQHERVLSCDWDVICLMGREETDRARSRDCHVNCRHEGRMASVLVSPSEDETVSITRYAFTLPIDDVCLALVAESRGIGVGKVLSYRDCLTCFCANLTRETCRDIRDPFSVTCSIWNHTKQSTLLNMSREIGP